jgi:membrane-associated two-gene conflict system component 1 (EACC1)
VRIDLSVQGGEPTEELAELADWLAQDDELRGLVKPAPAVPVAGELGVSSDVLVAAVGGGGAVSVLAASLQAFLTQPRRSDVTIVLTAPDGRRVEIDAKRVRDVEALVRQVCGEVE